MNNSEMIYQALKPDFAANLKEVNDLIDNDISYMKEKESCEEDDHVYDPDEMGKCAFCGKYDLGAL